MRKAMVFALALLAVPALASAQGGGQRGPGGGPGMMQANTAKLLLEKRADLGLSAEQVTKIEAVAKAVDEKNAPILEEVRAARQAGGDRQAMMSKMMQLRTNDSEAYEKDIKPLLSAEQAEKAAKIIEEARPRRPGGGGL